MSLVCESVSVETTLAIGAVLAKELRPDGILLLTGELGTGKTVLAQGVATGLGIRPEEVQSPSFTLMRDHHGTAGDLIHIDLYRLEPEQVETLGLWEVLGGPGIKVVEWAERLPFEVEDATRISLDADAVSARRRIVIEDEVSTRLRARLQEVCESRL